MKEEEAKTKWFPHAGPTFCGEGIIYSPTERPVVLDESKTDVKSVGDRCIGSRCMAWRWGDSSDLEGYCGLAGKP